MSFTYINGSLYWKTRTPTKNGYVDDRPAWAGSVFGSEASTAMRRKEQRAYDRQRDAHRVTLRSGMLVIFDRKPYRIVEIREIPPDLWGEEWHERFEAAVADWERYPNPLQRQRWPRPELATWRDRPVSVVLRPDKQPQAQPIHLRGRASQQWDVLPEHYAVCNACGELPPCQHEIDEDRIERTMDRTEELMAIQPGCCLGCTEPITSRMKAVRFPGPNLWRPDLGPDSAVFHARQECSGAADSYRKQWEEKGHAEAQPELPVDDGPHAD